MDHAREVLQQVFGYPQFRPPQDAIIDTLLQGGDALVLMPTGGGKSLCYQIPALLRPGCGIVISPLIALMQDQVDALRLLGVKAGFLNSTLDPQTTREVEQALLDDQLDLLYIAPERLRQPRTLALLHEVTVALFAIDEAHCVSQWGHDFRADYLELSLLHQQFPAVPRIALTATADARTRQEIIQRLDLASARQFIAGFDRPNIRYRIALKQNPKQQLLRFLKDEHPGDAGIVYCLSRARPRRLPPGCATKASTRSPYHAGMDKAAREANQQRFQHGEGIVMVATIAFGMGIDKPDVRFVAHLDLPKTVESYYQETGRAGRDGLPADAWMIYGLQDVIKLRQMLAGSSAAEEHRRAEQQRLNAMLGLCEITTCRRQALLAYFGEFLDQPCGNCDTCLEPADTWDGTEAAQLALSIAYRTGHMFGVNHLVDILRGAENDRIFQYRHHHLPLYGKGTDMDNNQWRSVFRQLVARGYLSVDLERFGALRLVEKCRPLLRGEERLDLRRDLHGKTVKQRTRTPLPEEIDVALWEALRDCRKELAEEQGIPPYVIFHDSTLREMCIELPQDLDQFGQLTGVGERKLEKYGPAFLRVLQDYRSGALLN